jgi:hypothetical protein
MLFSMELPLIPENIAVIKAKMAACRLLDFG